jgi:hypothetical protein
LVNHSRIVASFSWKAPAAVGFSFFGEGAAGASAGRSI